MVCSRFYIYFCGILILATTTFAEDWPTHRKDNARSGVSQETLNLPLSQSWVHRSTHPDPAWPGPAQRDGWHKTENLKPRVIFDWAYHTISADGKVFYGSSADDKVYCLDETTGEELWSFFTEGPIRLAPTYHEGKVYVGSDDGKVYCLDANNGEMIWQTQPSGLNYKVSGNGRMISLWPIRTGVLIDEGIAYFCAGLFPLEGVYVCAVNAETGTELWKHRIENIPPQGYLLSSDTRLYVTTGRGTPAVFDKQSGEYLYSMGGSGGTFALLTEDTLVYGPGKTGEMDIFSTNTDQNDQLATFQGNHMVVTPERTYMHTDTEMSALDRARHTQLIKERKELSDRQRVLTDQLKELGKNVEGLEAQQINIELRQVKERLGEIPKELDECILWEQECLYPYSLILAGDLLFSGGEDKVAAFSTKDGSKVWEQVVKGRALEMITANGSLLVSTDEGFIYNFKSNDN